MVQSSSSSRARSKRVMNQTMFDVPDPLVVHVLLLTPPLVVHVLLLTPSSHRLKYNVICLPHSWYPQCDRCPAT